LFLSMLTCTLLFFNAFSFRMIFDILPLCVLIYYYINNLFRCCANLYRFYTMGKGVYFMEVQKLFKANKRESAVDIVVNNIKHLLMERKLKPGDRLPSESEISEGMGVSRGSVREAMKILSAFGLVDVKVGNGTYVCEKPGSTLMDSLLLSFFVTNPDPEKLYELRQVIEIDVLEMILRHYDENTAERKALRENLNLLGKLIDKDLSLEQLKTIDLEFHHLMGSCTKNVLMERIYSIVLDFMEPTITATLKTHHGEITYQEHQKILEVIETQDYDRIHDVITDSVNTWSTRQQVSNL